MGIQMGMLPWNMNVNDNYSYKVGSVKLGAPYQMNEEKG